MTDTATATEPQKVIIRHGLFRYYVPEVQIVEGQDKEVLVERMAFHNEEVELPRIADFERGERLGAFWSREQALEHYDALGIPAPLLGQIPVKAQPDEAEAEEGEEVEITTLDEDDLVDWLMSTGQFDGQTKPTVTQVVEAGQEGGPAFARTLEAAEKRASADAPRQGVTDGLQKIQ
jgi:hypothetical protein